MVSTGQGTVVFARSRGSGRGCVHLVVTEIGEDLLVTVCGGTQPHIGAVAVGVPYPRQRGDGCSASVSVHTLVGHKDDTVAVWTADLVARSVNRVTVAIAGIHIDNAAPHEINALVQTSRELVAEFLSQFE